MTDWVDFAYTLVALIVSGLLVFVMQQAETDRTSKIDHPTLQWLRRLAFTIAALTLLYSISSIDWKLTCLILVSASGVLLAINAVALGMRAPPNNKGRRSYPFKFLYPYRGLFTFLYSMIHRK
jgi:hypothetical protein